MNFADRDYKFASETAPNTKKHNPDNTKEIRGDD